MDRLIISNLASSLVFNAKLRPSSVNTLTLKTYAGNFADYKDKPKPLAIYTKKHLRTISIKELFLE
ncbi:hypothetical protein [Pedobacter panaciterrae]|uniref:hypothetical protein n=1 Tax=Pedobacter panaciterrae TaxID=363849 RepID=UPI001C2085AB|nr:hypothetical protein [Pedobacter panaciterrae]